MLFIKKLNRHALRFGGLYSKLKEEPVLGNDAYPENMNEAQMMMLRHSKLMVMISQQQQSKKKHVNFAQVGENANQISGPDGRKSVVAGTNGLIIHVRHCADCGKYGYCKNE